MSEKKYEIANARDLWMAGYVGSDGHPLISGYQVCPDGEKINVPHVSFGIDENLLETESFVSSIDKVFPGPLAVAAPEIYFVRDCIIWTKYGIVTVGNYLLKETLFCFPNYLVPEIEFSAPQTYDGWARIDLASPAVTLKAAVSTLTGMYENYYHYLMFYIAKLDPSVFYAPQWKNKIEVPCVIVPGGMDEYRIDGLERLCNVFGASCIEVEDKTCIRVQNLALPNFFRQSGVVPHQLIKRPLRLLQKSFPPSRSENTQRKIYISRRDSNNRKLENEEEIEKIVGDCGFEIIVLTGLSLSEQIELFANASHIVGPHGAGLANIVFCKVGAKVLEIQIKSYQNWCYRRLAGVFGLDYGCLLGLPSSRGQESGDSSYYLEPYPLKSVLSDSKFIGTV